MSADCLRRFVRIGISVAFLAMLTVALPDTVSAQLQKEVKREAGAAVFGAYEGWYKNQDGTFSLLVGYYNRNSKQELDVPLGPNNHIEPGGPDLGQPTHFLTGRRYGMFILKVPADFGKNKLTWTIVANGTTTAIPFSLNPDYEVSPFVSTASIVGKPGEGDTPPILRFEEKGPSAQGPVGLVTQKTAKVGTPLSVTTLVADDAAIFTNSGAIPKNLGLPVTVTWTKYRGPGPVTFDKVKPDVTKTDRVEKGMVFAGTATVNATFSEPGDYILHVQLNDYSGVGGGGFQCCWTNGEVKVTVTP
jgi:hypothetical protein